MAAMVNAGQLMDITDKVSSETKKNISSGSFKAETYQDKVWAMPIAVLPGGLFYSQDLFKAAGITEAPKTIDDLNADVTKLKATGVAPIALGAKDAWPAAHWFYWFALRECAGSTMEKTADSKSFSDGCWLKAAEDLQKFAETKPFNDGFLTTSAQQGAGSSAGLVANHKAAMELMGAWDPGVIASLTPDQKPLPDLGFYPFPEVPGGKGEPGSIMGGVDGYSCSVKAPKECVDFLNFVATTDQQEAYYKAFNAPPVNAEAQKVVTEPYLKDVLAAYNKAPFVSQWLDTVLGQNVGNALNVAVVDMLAGKSDPKQLIQAANDAAKKG
jgi:raffinose/stachyose/melibiose transport system substrate-binding protein